MEAELRKIKDDDSRPIFGFGPSPDGSFVQSSILGFVPLISFEDLDPVAANGLSAVYADFNRAYTIVDRTGVRVLRDPYSGKPFVEFYATKRTGGDVTNFEALKILRISAS